jgi:uncharacterized protein DUF6644
MWLPLFQALEGSAVGQAIKGSAWAFAVIESVHLLALATIGGGVLLMDLRLLGVGLRRQSVAEIARTTQPIVTWSLVVMIVTGVALFLSEAVKCYYSTPFRVKMVCLLLATIFTFTVKRRATGAAEGSVRPLWLKVVALVSLALWFGVGAGGRWIGFSG